MPRTIGIFTGDRAEYSLQVPILRAINVHPELDYRLVVACDHLEEQRARTLAEIQADGFRVHAEVSLASRDDDLTATARAIGAGVVAMVDALADLRPNILVVYGDRFEAFAAVVAASQMGLPVAHVEGGDLTEGGSLDDSVRHAITKLAHLHFATNQQSANRILAMGEESWRVHTVGLPSLDLVRAGDYAATEEVVRHLKLDLSRPIILFTQHAVATEHEAAADQLMPSLAALAQMAHQGAQVIVTYPNNDAGGRSMRSLLDRWFSAPPPHVQLHPSLGRRIYHGVLALAADPENHVVCVGNSSSGVKEMAVFGCPAVDIGNRQRGRLRARNVLHAEHEVNAIVDAVKKCLFDADFRRVARKARNPYGEGDAGDRIARVLANVSLDPSLVQKGMTLRGETSSGWFR